jgi:hypothetical protein
MGQLYSILNVKVMQSTDEKKIESHSGVQDQGHAVYLTVRGKKVLENLRFSLFTIKNRVCMRPHDTIS